MKKLFIMLILMLTILQTVSTYAEVQKYALVSATNVRIRNIPSTKGAIAATLKLGTWAKISAISNDKVNLIGKNDFWYKIIDDSQNTGWIFGGLILKSSLEERFINSANLIGSRLKLTGKPIKDEIQIYDFVKNIKDLPKDIEQKGKLQFLYLNSIQKILDSLSLMGQGMDGKHKVIKENQDLVYYHESAGQYFVKPQEYWALTDEYSSRPGLAEEIAWKAAKQQLPGETEGDPFATLSSCEMSYMTYVQKFPLGSHIKYALKEINGEISFIKDELKANKNYFSSSDSEAKKLFLKILNSLKAAVQKCKSSKVRKNIIKNIGILRYAVSS